MSVILDALHKARGDKRNVKSESQPHSVARVLEAGVAPDVPLDVTYQRLDSKRGRGIAAGIAVAFGLLCLLALIGGGFFLLYDQVRRLEAKAATQPLMPPASVAPANTDALLNASPLELPPTPALPPPVPMEELPVQPPAAVAKNGMAGAGATATGALPVARPEIRLGSIVCEAGVCVAGLNGRSVRVGDEIRGYQVMQITETAVTLQSVNSSDVMTLSQFD